MIYKYLCFLVLVIATSAEGNCNNGVTCVTLESCTGLYSQLQKGSNQHLTTLLRSLHCGFDGDDPMVCCPPEFQTDGQPTRLASNSASAASGSFSSPAYEYSNSFSGSSSGSDSSSSSGLLPSSKECGIQTNDRIVGGQTADLDEHPWMALLRYDKPSGWGFYCGGVLISSRYVMTAAHCVKGLDLPRNWRLTQVRLGEWNTTTSKDCLGSECVSGKEQDIGVEEIIAHENYNPADTNQHNDIALLRLSRPAQSTDFVRPICLPSTDALRSSSFDGYDMEVAGWGKTESRSESEIKLKVVVPIVPTSECARVYQRQGANRRIVNKQICAGGAQGQDSCRGDSGGALMGRVDGIDNWIAVGVVSYGPSPCGTRGWPGVYTRVGAYVDWIMGKIRA